jgi:hypothetical protein
MSVSAGKQKPGLSLFAGQGLVYDFCRFQPGQNMNRMLSFFMVPHLFLLWLFYQWC